MDDEKIVLDKELLKAIGADTRINILKSLANHQKTQTDLSKELNLSAPTILEHLNQLESAGLVEKQDEGRKWKYYVLTRKGKSLMNSSKKKIAINALILLGVIFIFVGAVFVQGFFNPITPQTNGDSVTEGFGYYEESLNIDESNQKTTTSSGIIQTESSDDLDALNSESMDLETIDKGFAQAPPINSTNTTNSTN